MVVPFTISYINGASTCNLFCTKYIWEGGIRPAFRAVSGGNHQIDQLAPHVSQWHGFNIANRHWFIG